MSLSEPDVHLSFFDASYQADHLFEAGSPYRLFREKILPLLEKARPALEGMYCATNGRPPVPPGVMAGVLLLQYIENLPDRMAAEQVRLHLGWKYALKLKVNDKGFHATGLTRFRDRLEAHEQARLVFDTILGGLQEAGLVREDRPTRLDSTHVLGVVAHLSRLDKVRETLRLALKEIAGQGVPEGWTEWEALWGRYGHPGGFERDRTVEQQRQRLAEVGEDAARVVGWLEAQPQAVRDREQAALLRRVFGEQFEIAGERVEVRPTEPAQAVCNPHDPQMQWSAKDPAKKTAWIGSKAQVEETVNDERPQPDGKPTPNFIRDIVTTEATASDFAGHARLKAQQQAQGRPLPPATHVDSGYVSDDTLAEAKAGGCELIGPPRPCRKDDGMLGADQFDVDIAERTATCPAGHASVKCCRIHDAYQKAEYYRFHWGRQCASCERRSVCTKAQERTVCVGLHHDALQERRRQMQDPSFLARLRLRNAIEGTISELVRNGMRRSRYRGLAKTALANLMHGAAVNVKRWFRLLAWHMKQAQTAAQAA